jgi:hypothetical protein
MGQAGLAMFAVYRGDHQVTLTSLVAGPQKKRQVHHVHFLRQLVI